MSETYEIIVPEFPKRVDRLVCEELEEMGSYVYIHEENGTTITLNPSGSAVFDMCDGSHRAENIAALISETLGVEHAVALRDVNDVLAELAGFGFFQN